MDASKYVIPWNLLDTADKLGLAAGLIVQLGIPAIGSNAVVVVGSADRTVQAGIETFWSFYFVDRCDSLAFGPHLKGL